MNDDAKRFVEDSKGLSSEPPFRMDEEVLDVNLQCDCIGIDRRSPCEEPATAEDGRCDVCRDRQCDSDENYEQFLSDREDVEQWLRQFPPFQRKGK